MYLHLLQGPRRQAQAPHLSRAMRLHRQVQAIQVHRWVTRLMNTIKVNPCIISDAHACLIAIYLYIGDTMSVSSQQSNKGSVNDEPPRYNGYSEKQVEDLFEKMLVSFHFLYFPLCHDCFESADLLLYAETETRRGAVSMTLIREL